MNFPTNFHELVLAIEDGLYYKGWSKSDKPAERIERVCPVGSYEGKREFVNQHFEIKIDERV